MSAVSSPAPRRLFPFLAAALAVSVAAGAGIWWAARRPATTSVTDLEAAETVPALITGTGKAGDVYVTAEAMELAEIRLGTAELRSVAEKLPVSGSVEAGGDRLVKITPRVPGKVVRLTAQVGDRVRAGQILGLIESTDLAKAQADYEHARLRLVLARTNLDRQRKMARLGSFGQPRMEEARREVVAAQGEVNTAQSEIAAARSEVLEARSEKAALEGEVAAAESGVISAQSEYAGGASEIAEAEGEVKARQAALTQAQTRLKTAESRFARLDTLLKEELVSRQDWEQSRAELDQARADIDSARAAVSQAQAKVETARAHRGVAQGQVSAAQAKVRAERGRVEQAEAKIRGSLARQAQVESRLETARKRVAIAERAVEREEKILRGGYATSKEIVEAEAHLQEAEHELEHSTKAVRLLGGTPGGGSRVALTSPIDGRVQSREVSPGETTDSEHPAFTVINLDLVWAQLAVQPADLAKIRKGQRVMLTSETAPGRTFSGTVSDISGTADEATRAVRVRVALVNRDGALRPQTYVRGEIVTDVRDERVTVPDGALQEHTGKMTVYVSKDDPGAFEVRHVKLGARGNGWREVTSDLKPGEKIAVNGTFYLKSEAMKSSLSDGCCAVPAGDDE